MEEIVDRQLSTPTQSTALLGAFALLALLLASLGIYGVLSYAVTQRTNEIGVRMALGATSGDILLSFGRRGLALTLAGLAIGLVLAAFASRSMTALLYGFRPDYVPTAAVVSLILVGVAALACFVPARRASRIDPDDRPAAGRTGTGIRSAESFVRGPGWLRKLPSHSDDVLELPRLVEERLGGAIEAEDRKPPSARNRLYPVALRPSARSGQRKYRLIRPR